MTEYVGPERRTATSPEHLADLLREVTSAEIRKAVRPVGEQVSRLARLIEGENGGRGLNAGVLGAITGLENTGAKLEARVIGLERKWDRLRWTVGGWALGGGLGGGSMVAWIAHPVSYTHLTPVSYTHLTLPTTPYV